MSTVALYNEKLTDFLVLRTVTQGPGMELRLNPDGGYSMSGLKKVVISDINEAIRLLKVRICFLILDTGTFSCVLRICPPLCTVTICQPL